MSLVVLGLAATSVVCFGGVVYLQRKVNALTEDVKVVSDINVEVKQQLSEQAAQLKDHVALVAKLTVELSQQQANSEELAGKLGQAQEQLKQLVLQTEGYYPTVNQFNAIMQDLVTADAEVKDQYLEIHNLCARIRTSLGMPFQHASNGKSA